MPEITAQAVKSLRERTGLPMMECKRALQETGGDENKAIELLRKQGKKTMEQRSGRETSSGRLATYASLAEGVGAIVEVRCESPSVAENDRFIQLTKDLAEQLAKGPGAKSADELLSQPAPSQAGKTLGEVRDDVSNITREVLNVTRFERIDGPCAAYTHFNGASAVLLEAEGADQEVAKDICMHIAAMKPAVVHTEELDPALVAKEREILAEAARKEGKPENIIDKMIEGRMRNFYAEQVLSEQPFIKDEKGKTTVGQAAQKAGLKLRRFIAWQLGKD